MLNRCSHYFRDDFWLFPKLFYTTKCCITLSVTDKVYECINTQNLISRNNIIKF